MKLPEDWEYYFGGAVIIFNVAAAIGFMLIFVYRVVT